ncbi:hypothetical protein S245_055256 [Arachis hypogaea]
MEPLQTVVDNKSHYHTPSPGRPSFSLGLTQLEKSPATTPLITVHPRLKGVKLGEEKEEMVQRWILNSRLEKDMPLATYEGRSYLQLSRLDLWTLKARGWVNSNVYWYEDCTFLKSHDIYSITGYCFDNRKR